ncbi:unnamed protein product [Brachionus calyciflorus]|uniref:DDE-1 domain-containing protein n=1 Tax=Brachionus calyciflorus TaxID=104777 RepID=A0A813XLV2_9BILA|nr:unnamed protein product [Brachionus calyciflorus]
MREAIQKYNEIHPTNTLSILCPLPKVIFRASRGWFYNFCNRRGFVLRRVSTNGRDLPNNVLNHITSFFENISESICSAQFSDAQILNMDESAIYLDAPSNYTYSPIGAKRVKANTSGSEKTRLSAAFTGVADGTKLPIFVMIPRKTPLKEFQPPPLAALHYSSSTSFDEETILIYIERIVLPYKLSKGINGKMLTNLLQPADVAWFSTLRKAYRQEWNNWYIYDEKTYTENQNMRSPGYALAIEWLNNIWQSFEDFKIRDSFALCGISNHAKNDDGSLSIDLPKLHSVLRLMLENNTFINDYVETDMELQEANEMMNENEENLLVFDTNNENEICNELCVANQEYQENIVVVDSNDELEETNKETTQNNN